MKSKSKCILNGCGAKVLSRGLCSKHYWLTADGVRKQETTWAKEEAGGLARPLKHPRKGRFESQIIDKPQNHDHVLPVSRPSKKEAKSLCLAPSCSHKVTTRGLCAAHYAFAYRLVKEGKTTWEKLEKRGRITPPLRRGPKASQHLEDYFLGK